MNQLEKSPFFFKISKNWIKRDCAGNAVTKKANKKKTCLIIEWNIHNFSYLSAQCVPNMFLRRTKGTHIIALFFFRKAKQMPI